MRTQADRQHRDPRTVIAVSTLACLALAMLTLVLLSRKERARAFGEGAFTNAI